MALADRSRFRVKLTSPGHYFHVLPSGTTQVELLSGYFIPRGDGRRLGACITSVALDGVPVALDRPMFDTGFHALEEREHTLSRWTDGCGVLVVPPRTEAQTLRSVSPTSSVRSNTT